MGCRASTTSITHHRYCNSHRCPRLWQCWGIPDATASANKPTAQHMTTEQSSLTNCLTSHPINHPQPSTSRSPLLLRSIQPRQSTAELRERSRVTQQPPCYPVLWWDHCPERRIP